MLTSQILRIIIFSGISVPSFAGLIGTTVTGTLYFECCSGSNLEQVLETTFNVGSPGAGLIYSSYGGPPKELTVYSATFTDSALLLENDLYFGTLPWEQTFTDTAFAGATITAVSDTFPNTGVIETLAGDTITLTWSGGYDYTYGQLSQFNAAYSVVPAVPEPRMGGLTLFIITCMVAWCFWAAKLKRKTKAQGRL